MRIRGVADDVRIECEEDGFWLHVTTDEGDEIQVRLPQDVALELAKQADQITAWWDEGKEMAAEHAREMKPGFAELDDAYEATDPKSPRFLETADLLRDRERGK